jgi:hypothetical protein
VDYSVWLKDLQHLRFARWDKYITYLLQQAPLIELFLIDGILDSDDSSFSRYNHLKSFVCCVWNIEHLSNVFF